MLNKTQNQFKDISGIFYLIILEIHLVISKSQLKIIRYADKTAVQNKLSFVKMINLQLKLENPNVIVISLV